ncbi:DUF2637 domain-containing protein [Pseudonocardia sp. NPDC049154]|uniref:DUF2637 domain-containing protein n=1 Tax=Pseudonocardia sp. NPDC049154 TaxID=3155501 RepID=UPI003405A8BC
MHGLKARWGRTWPVLLAVGTVSAVGGPAAVASYRHAREVIADHGDPVMAPWLALTTDGMLLAALVVIWVRRHRGEAAGAGPLAAFWAGMTATLAANLAAAEWSVIGVIVALWPPVCLAITLELVALVAHRTARTAEADHPDRTAVEETGPLELEAGPEEWSDPWDRWAGPAVHERTADERTADRTGADRALTSDGPADRVVEDELVPAVREWAVRQTGPISQRAVRAEFGVGAVRAAKLLEAVR